MKLSELEDCSIRQYNNSSGRDYTYYKPDGTKVYCIRFYHKNHIRARRTGTRLQRIDFTESWYTGKIN